MTEAVERMGYDGHFSLDLTTTDETGQPWNLADKHMQEKPLRD